jgi:hypothetical protein
MPSCIAELHGECPEEEGRGAKLCEVFSDDED